MKILSKITAGLITAALMSTAHAQFDTVKMMIPANPAGGWDQTGRNLAQAMQQSGAAKTVNFENKGGAGGTIGLAQFVNSTKGDPNSVMIGGFVMVGAIALNNPPVKLNQVTPIARLTSEYLALVVPASSPFKTLKDLAAAMKANPGAVSIAGGSAGGTDHMVAGIMAGLAGVEPSKVNYVAFAGGGDAINAILGSQVSAGISGVGEFAEQIKAGKVRALAVTAPTKIDGIPTFKEQGMDLEFGNWRGIFAAPDITTAQRDALVAAVKKSIEAPHWKATLEKMNWTSVPLFGDDYKAAIVSETARAEKIIDLLGLKKK
jgi:putative tricarboxylic transport membrane protein